MRYEVYKEMFIKIKEFDLIFNHFSENAANVSSLRSASSIATISSSLQVFFKKDKNEFIYSK